jgi:cytochrome d ubiquinol oxidase subunit II
VSAADACAVVLWIGVTLYAVLAGADFGSGFWDLTGGGAERGRGPRALIDRAVGPVWEANHVWLVFCLVVLWTAFPDGFAAIFSTLFLPFTLAALGIVLRGAGFAFRRVASGTAGRRAWGAVFAVSSVLTPFFLGAALGGIASGRVPPGNAAGDPLTSWANPSGLVVGLLAVAGCAHLAAMYLYADARRGRDAAMERWFRTRALAAGVATGAIAAVGLVVLHGDAPHVGGRLLGAALPLVVLSALLGVVALVAAWRGAAPLVRVPAAGAVAAVVWAWGVAQWPYLLPTTLTFEAAAGDATTLAWVVVVFILALVVVVPLLGVLLWLDLRDRLQEDPG